MPVYSASDDKRQKKFVLLFKIGCLPPEETPLSLTSKAAEDNCE